MRGVGLLSAAVWLAARAWLGAPCFAEPATTQLAGPATVGRPTHIGTACIAARPGETVVLQSLTLAGVDPSAVSGHVLAMGETGHGGIGGVDGDTFSDGLSFARLPKPIDGVVPTADMGPVQSVAEFASRTRARLESSDAVLRFTVDGRWPGEQWPPAFGGGPRHRGWPPASGVAPGIGGGPRHRGWPPASGVAGFDSPRPSGCS